LCAGASTTLTASGGTPYTWSTTAITAAITVSPASSTTYTVTVTNSNGCTASASSLVTVNSLPNAAVTPSAASLCSGQSTTLTASGGGTYLWSFNNATTAAITVSPAGSTTYTVTVTSGTGCSATASATVNVSASLTPVISPPNPSVCSGQSVALSV